MSKNSQASGQFNVPAGKKMTATRRAQPIIALLTTEMPIYIAIV
jgi:hypothetical protein